MILNGVVFNIVVAQESDYKYPPYIWVQLTNLYGSDGNPISPGSLYDGVNFTSPSGN